MEADDYATIRVGIVGDCGVGKSMLASQLSGDVMTTAMYSPTTGCGSHVRLMNDAQSGQSFFVELYDIGGNPRFESSQPVFYNELDGIMFVWDCSSEYTFHSIENWISGIKKQQSRRQSLPTRDPELLIIGNKADKIGKEELEKLQKACPRHVFTCSRSISFDHTPFNEYFSRIYWMTGGPLRS